MNGSSYLIYLILLTDGPALLIMTEKKQTIMPVCGVMACIQCGN